MCLKFLVVEHTVGRKLIHFRCVFALQRISHALDCGTAIMAHPYSTGIIAVKNLRFLECTGIRSVHFSTNAQLKGFEKKNWVGDKPILDYLFSKRLQ